MNSETNVRTKLEVRVDARQVGDLKREIKGAFDPATARGLATEATALNRVLAQTVRLAERAGENLAKVGQRAADQWGKLADELERVARAAQSAHGAMSGGGGGGGVGPGMMGSGGPGRGGTGSLLHAQAPMPGMGALMIGLSAIPGIGLLAAGSLAAAAGTYSSHLKYQGAYAQASPFLARSHAMGGFSRNAAMMGGAAGRAQFGAEQGEVGAATQALWAASSAQGGAQARNAAIAGLRGPIGEPGARVASGTFQNTSLGQATIAQATNAEQNKKRDAALGRLKTASARVDAAYASGGSLAAAAMFDANAYRDVGARFGVGPGESLTEAAGMSRAMQGRASAEDYRFGKSVEALHGVGTDATGGLMGELAYAGNVGGQEDVADIIGSAVARNLENSQIGTYLQSMTGFLQRQTSQGQLVSYQGLLRSAEALQAGGIARQRAGEIAQSFGGAGVNLGVNGPGGATDFHAMRAFGYTGQGGAEEYAKIRLDMQDAGKWTPEVMSSYLGGITGGTTGDTKAFLTQRAMAGMGTGIGAGEARSLAAGGIGGDLGITARGKAGDIMSEGEAWSAATRGSMRAEAAIEGERVGTGGKVAKDMQNLSRATNNMANAFMNTFKPALDAVTGSLEDFTASLARGAWSYGKKAPQ